MKIIIGLGHPAHYHLFKGLIRFLIEEGYEFIVVILGKDVLANLLKNDGIPYIQIIKKKQTNKISTKISEQLKANRKFHEIIRTFKPTILLGCINQIAYYGWLKRIPSLFFAEDDFKATMLQGALIYPFVSKILTPACTNVGPFKFKQVKYNSYHELAYLHPNVFKPNRNKISMVIDQKPYFIIRFSDLNAYHDINKAGISTALSYEIINTLESHGNVFITSEKELEPHLERYRLKIKPSDIHNVLYYADMFIGDSQTMTAEAAVLGTPAIRFNDFVGRLSYLEELEHKYDLTYGFKTNQSKEFIEKIKALLDRRNLKQEWHIKRDKMLSLNIDFSELQIRLIQNFPDSIQSIIKEDRDIRTW